MKSLFLLTLCLKPVVGCNRILPCGCVIIGSSKVMIISFCGFVPQGGLTLVI